jgi:hypothetical protein
MSAAGNEKTPKIEFQSLIHDFGEVGKGANYLCEFQFTNTGDGVLKIEQVTPTCNCTPFLLEKTEYAPGESGTLKVRYYAEAQYGATKKQLIVQSNDRQNPKIVLAIEAQIVSKVEFEPSALNLLLKYQNAACPDITLTSRDNKPFSILFFRSTANCITADYNPLVKDTKFVLTPKVDIEKLKKVLNGRIEIGLTHPECKVVTIDLKAVPRFRLLPTAIVMHGVESKKTVVKKVRIYSNYKENFELVSAISPKGIVNNVVNPKKIPNGYELELQITPPSARSGTKGFTETFLVKLKDGEELQIPCSGFYLRETAQRQRPRSVASTANITSTAKTKNKNDCADCIEDCEGDDCKKVFTFNPPK